MRRTASGTLGRRVASFLMKSAWRQVGESASLDRPKALEGLFQGGGLALFGDHRDASHYGTQTGRRPPEITLFCNSPARLGESYRRYLLLDLCDTFGFHGTPVRLKFRKSE